ncbi:hypothetical protein QO179_24295 [Bacillus stercoris]|nr:hypothetical protein [Bacillus stercoris]
MNELKVTKCAECGKEIKYTTKKPRVCSVCRSKKKKDAKSKTSPKKPSGSNRKYPDNKNTQGELILFRALDSLLEGYDYINHGYYSFLLSPKGYPLQIDRYYPDLKLGWEFDGKQHAEYNKYIHKSKKNFDYYKECDKLKEKYCKEKGITLIRVAWNHKITEDALKIDIKKKNRDLYRKLFGGKSNGKRLD